MVDRLAHAALRQRVLDVLQVLRDHYVALDDKVGWHNALKPDRIGTTGTAYPVVFFLAAGEAIPEADKVLAGLRRPQADDGRAAAWGILSLGERTNVEGTSWPLLALMAAGDERDRALVERGQTWLRDQQNPDGGWGSTNVDESRVTLTASAVAALTTSSPWRTSCHRSAEQWLRASQRSKDGSWGPTNGEAGTLAHTCLALLALSRLGVPPTDPALIRAHAFIREHWQPRPRYIQTETYEVRDVSGYQRLEHDVDVLAVHALLRLRSHGDLSLAIRGVRDILEVGVDDLDVEHPSLWNILPRGFLALELLAVMPPLGGHVIHRGQVTAIVDDRAAHPGRTLAALALQESPVTRERSLRALVGVALLVIAALTALLALGRVTIGEFLTGVVLPVAFGAYGLVSSRGGHRA